MAAFSPDPQQTYLYIGSSTSYRKIYIFRRSDLTLLGSFDTVAGHHEMAVDSKGNIYTTDGRSRKPMRYLFKEMRSAGPVARRKGQHGHTSPEHKRDSWCRARLPGRAGCARPDRMPPIPKDKMTAEQQKVVAERGNLVGPWVPLSRSPEVLGLMMDMRRHVANRSLLSPALTEIPILISAREWTQHFEWNAHEAIATKAGLKAEIINAIKEGRRPRQMTSRRKASTTCAWSFSVRRA